MSLDLKLNVLSILSYFFIYLFSEQIFIVCLIFARHFIKCCAYNHDKQNSHGLVLIKFIDYYRKQILNKQANKDYKKTGTF